MSKKQVEEENMNIGLSREDTFGRSKWIVGVNPIATKLKLIRPPSLDEDITGFYTLVSPDMLFC